MIAFPISLDDLFADIGVAEATLTPSDPRSMMETRGGSIETMNVGQWLWYGTVTVNMKYTANQRRAEAALEGLKQSGATFLVTDLRQPFPASDPAGTILGAASPTLAAIDAGRLEIDVDGLPAAYELKQGDLLSFISGGIHYLHRVMRDNSADGSGLISGLDVFPRISANVSAGPAIVLEKPSCKGVMRPSAYTPSRHLPLIADGMSFEWVQTLR